MAKIEIKSKVILTKEEEKLLSKVYMLYMQLDQQDKEEIIFRQCEDCVGGWLYFLRFIENLQKMVEVE